MQLFLLYVLDGQILVDDGGNDEEGLREHLEFEVDVHDPIQEDRSHPFSNLRLPADIIAV